VTQNGITWEKVGRSGTLITLGKAGYVN